MKTSPGTILKLGSITIVVVSLGFLIVRQKPNEPPFQGKPLSYWLAQLDMKSARDGTNEAAAAVRSMGTNALPRLTQMLLTDVSDWEWWLREQRWFPFRWGGNERIQEQGSFGLACLREQAVPTLERLLTNHTTTPRSAITLGRMAPVGTTVLAHGLTNNDANVRLWCAMALSSVGTWKNEGQHYYQRVAGTARLAVPALVTRLSDSNTAVATTAARALGNLREMPDIVPPALVSASTNSALDPVVRASASVALRKFQQGGSR